MGKGGFGGYLTLSYLVNSAASLQKGEDDRNLFPPRTILVVSLLLMYPKQRWDRVESLLAYACLSCWYGLFKKRSR